MNIILMDRYKCVIISSLDFGIIFRLDEEKVLCYTYQNKRLWGWSYKHHKEGKWITKIKNIEKKNEILEILKKY